MKQKDELDFTNAKRGAIRKPQTGKTRITIRIDSDLLDWFRKQVHQTGGGNYQTLINEALRTHVRAQNATLEDMLRKVIREELGEKPSKGKRLQRNSSLYA